MEFNLEHILKELAEDGFYMIRVMIDDYVEQDYLYSHGVIEFPTPYFDNVPSEATLENIEQDLAMINTRRLWNLQDPNKYTPLARRVIDFTNSDGKITLTPTVLAVLFAEYPHQGRLYTVNLDLITKTIYYNPDDTKPSMIANVFGAHGWNLQEWRPG